MRRKQIFIPKMRPTEKKSFGTSAVVCRFWIRLSKLLIQLNVIRLSSLLSLITTKSQYKHYLNNFENDQFFDIWPLRNIRFWKWHVALCQIRTNYSIVSNLEETVFFCVFIFILFCCHFLLIDILIHFLFANIGLYSKVPIDKDDLNFSKLTINRGSFNRKGDWKIF